MSDYPWTNLPDIKPGSKIGVQCGNTFWTQTVENTTYSTQPYIAAPELSRLAADAPCAYPSTLA